MKTETGKLIRWPTPRGPPEPGRFCRIGEAPRLTYDPGSSSPIKLV